MSEVVGKIKLANQLSDYKVWQYARIMQLAAKKYENQADQMGYICEVLELSSDLTAAQWLNDFRGDFVVEMFGKVSKVLEQQLPNDVLEHFMFTTLTPEDDEKRVNEIKAATMWNKQSLRNDLRIDRNRMFVVGKLKNITFEQIIQAEMVQNEIVTLDAAVAVKDFAKLARLLAFICTLEGERLHYLDQNDKQWRFDYGKVDYREKLFKHLDIVTAWRCYLAFFLTEPQHSPTTITSGMIWSEAWKNIRAIGRHILRGGAG